MTIDAKPIDAKPFDVSEFIDDDETQAEILNDALMTGDRRAVIHVIGIIARARGMSEMARTTGINRTTLYQMMEEDANPSFEAVLKIVSALDMTLGAHAKDRSEAAIA